MKVEPGEVRGRVAAPSSKSVSIRALVAAALARGESRLSQVSDCNDALAAIRALTALGARFQRDGVNVVVHGPEALRGARLSCGESALCLRMLAPVAALQPGEAVLEAEGSLARRPVEMLEAPLRALGVECTTNAGLPPVHVRGPLVGGTVTLDASKTSQFLTGLLFALPLCEQDSTLEVSALASQGYIETTLEVLRAFGVHCECEPGFKRFTVKGRQRFAAREYAVEGDWSGAAFLLVAGAVAGEVEVCGLRVDSTQVDARILDVLAGCGAAVDVGESVHVAKSALRAFRYDVTDTPDLLPALAALACSCEGTSEILGVERTRQKESDRVLAISSALGGLGADIRVEADRLLVTGGTLHGGAADPQGDHRIAMAAAVAALRASGAVEISDPQCVAKSYPSFFDDLRSLRP